MFYVIMRIQHHQRGLMPVVHIHACIKMRLLSENCIKSILNATKKKKRKNYVAKISSFFMSHKKKRKKFKKNINKTHQNRRLSTTTMFLQLPPLKLRLLIFSLLTRATKMGCIWLLLQDSFLALSEHQHEYYS